MSMLLDGQRVKLLLKTRPASLMPHSRSLCSQWMLMNAMIHDLPSKGLRNATLRGTYTLQTPSQGSGIILEESGKTEDYQETLSSGYGRTAACMNSQQFRHPCEPKPDPIQQGQVLGTLSAQAAELLAIVSYRERKSPLSLESVALGKSATLQDPRIFG